RSWPARRPRFPRPHRARQPASPLARSQCPHPTRGGGCPRRRAGLQRPGARPEGKVELASRLCRARTALNIESPYKSVAAPVPTLIHRPATIVERLDLAALFPKSQPLEVELGSGDGSFLAQWAQ